MIPRCLLAASSGNEYPNADDAFAGVPAVRRFWSCRLAGDFGPRAWLLQFDPTAVSLDSFVHAGIDCPQSIARSVAKRQAEFFCGRLVAREALRREGVTTWLSPIGIGASHEPLWPSGVAGSLSHSRDIAAVVVAPARRYPALGLDVEFVVGGATRDAVAGMALDRDELGLLSSAGAADSFDERITLAFSAKESLFKAAFPAVGRYFYFDAARVTAFDDAGGRLLLMIAKPVGSGYDVGRVCEVRFSRPNPGAVMTLCVPDVPPETGRF